MSKAVLHRTVSAVVGVLLLGGGLSACCLPGGGNPPPGCQSATTASFGVPFTVCLPDDAARVAVSFTGGDVPLVASVTCSTDVLVKTANADNFSCASWSSNTDLHRTLPAGPSTIEFGVANPSGNPPGAVTVTITPPHP
jgi:hypothetical protein